MVMYIGKVIERLTVVGSRVERRGSRNIRLWKCKCVCGNETEITDSSRPTKSCGCLNRDRLASQTIYGQSNSIGDSRSPEYHTWSGMIHRCFSDRGDDFKRYKSRGITVCERWMVYDNFLKDMGRRPSPKHSLDRIDNDGNYEPGNCRWATKSDQAKNTRRTRILTVDGVSKSMKDWAILVGVPYGAIQARLNRGWSHEKAVLAPLRSDKRRKCL